MDEPRKDKLGRIYPKRKGAPEGGWPTMPEAPKWTARVPLRKAPRGAAYTDSPKSALEVLSRLAGATTFKEPTTGRATGGRTITNEDIAHALGHVHDPLVQRLALAIACGTISEWPRIQQMAYPLLVQDLQASHNTRKTVTGANKYRIHLVLHHVFFDLALQRLPTSAFEAAKTCRMQVRDYKALYKAIAGFIETKAQEGAHIAKRVLYGGE
ncbi:MAG: hypothetical protein WA777_18485 [Rhodanobacter sp.]